MEHREEALRVGVSNSGGRQLIPAHDEDYSHNPDRSHAQKEGCRPFGLLPPDPRL